jgi:hypothetical protein
MTNLTISSKEPTAKIAVNKSVLSEYQNGNFFLKNETEFQIELFNPTSNTIAAKVFINDVQISSSLLVIKPGERIWLERFIDSNQKFKFNTYSIDNSAEALEAIKSNGKVKVEFYNEQLYTNTITTYYTGWVDDSNYKKWNWNGPNYYKKWNEIYNGNISSDMNLCSGKSFNCSLDVLSPNETEKVETGRIEQGSKSNQQFSNYYGDFNFWPFKTINLQILPFSAKLIDKRDLKNIFCPNCGKAVKQKDNFCKYCGSKL